MYLAESWLVAAYVRGASGFLLKNSQPGQLAHAIRVVAEGESMLAPSVTHRLINAFTALPSALLSGAPPAAVPSPADVLTDRELPVLVLVARGLSNAQIAAALDLTEANVKSRVNRILNRLGLDNRVQAALLVYDTGLLDRS